MKKIKHKTFCEITFQGENREFEARRSLKKFDSIQRIQQISRTSRSQNLRFAAEKVVLQKVYIFLIAFGLLAGIVLLFINKAQISDHSEIVVLNIDGRDYNLLTARTALKKTLGLSGIKELKDADGMIFYFEPATRPTFWNKNTHLDLEIIWMSGDKIVGRDFLAAEDKAGLITKIAPAEIDRVVELIMLSH